MDDTSGAGAPSDEELMERDIDGGAEAFETLFLRYRQPLFRYLLYSLASHAAAEDVFQDTFLRVIKGRKTYRRTGSFKAWLFKIARNTTIDRHRRARIRPDTAAAVELDETRHATGERTSLAFLIREAIRAMPETQRDVFLLREEGLSFSAIAELVGSPVPTVKSRMRYALVHLRDHLQEKNAGEREVCQ